MFKRFAGVIRVGDCFEWAPYGHEAWPRATARIEVTDIVRNADGEVWVRAGRVVAGGEHLGEEKDDAWNEEDHFREMVGNHEPITAVSLNANPSPWTTANPKPATP